MTTERKDDDDVITLDERDFERDAYYEPHWLFTAQAEGVVPHLYRDTRGHVTCGVGFRVPTREDLDAYAWQPDIATARADYERVRVAKPGMLANAYLPLCNATLTYATMRAHFEAHVALVVSQLSDWKLETRPQAARVAVVDMAFNLGIVGLNRFVKLKAAVLARRWADAAAECSRKGVGAARNTATRELFEELAQNARHGGDGGGAA